MDTWWFCTCPIARQHNPSQMIWKKQRWPQPLHTNEIEEHKSTFPPKWKPNMQIVYRSFMFAPLVLRTNFCKFFFSFFCFCENKKMLWFLNIFLIKFFFMMASPRAARIKFFAWLYDCTIFDLLLALHNKPKILKIKFLTFIVTFANI